MNKLLTTVIGLAILGLIVYWFSYDPCPFGYHLWSGTHVSRCYANNGSDNWVRPR